LTKTNSDAGAEKLCCLQHMDPHTRLHNAFANVSGKRRARPEVWLEAWRHRPWQAPMIWGIQHLNYCAVKSSSRMISSGRLLADQISLSNLSYSTSSIATQPASYHICCKGHKSGKHATGASAVERLASKSCFDFFGCRDTLLFSYPAAFSRLTLQLLLRLSTLNPIS
jgi:hypothetical protein